MEEANARRAVLDQQAANRKAAGITYGFGSGRYGTVPNSWPEQFGGAGRYGIGAAGQNSTQLRAGAGEKENKDPDEHKHKKRRLGNESALNLRVESAGSSEQEVDITKTFPYLGNGAPSSGPMLDVAPRAPSLGTPFDPHANPDWFNPNRKSREQILESLFRLKMLPPTRTSKAD